MLGGSSGLNFLVWNRASMYEYDAWEALGNPGWVILLRRRNIFARSH
jgi:GMC oxidoreductase